MFLINLKNFKWFSFWLKYVGYLSLWLLVINICPEKIKNKKTIPVDVWIQCGCRQYSSTSQVSKLKHVCCWQTGFYPVGAALAWPPSFNISSTVQGLSIVCTGALWSACNLIRNTSDAFTNCGFTSEILIQICWLCLCPCSFIWSHVFCSSWGLILVSFTSHCWILELYTPFLQLSECMYVH